MITSLAKRFDGYEWRYVTKYLGRQFNYVGTNRYILTDGSEVEKVSTKIGEMHVNVVKFIDDGIRIKAANGHKRN